MKTLPRKFRPEFTVTKKFPQKLQLPVVALGMLLSMPAIASNCQGLKDKLNATSKELAASEQTVLLCDSNTHAQPHQSVCKSAMEAWERGVRASIALKFSYVKESCFSTHGPIE